MATYYKGETVDFLSYVDGEWHSGDIEYFTEEGLTTVAALRQDGKIVLIRLSNLKKKIQ